MAKNRSHNLAVMIYLFIITVTREIDIFHLRNRGTRATENNFQFVFRTFACVRGTEDLTRRNYSPVEITA